MGGLQEDLGRGVRDLGVAATHDPGDRLRLRLGVADQQVLGVQGTLDAVERADLLVRPGAPHDDPPAREPVEVERMERLVPLQEHIVRDVDHVADRAHARLHEALLHPPRRRADGHRADRDEVPGAPAGLLDR